MGKTLARSDIYVIEGEDFTQTFSVRTGEDQPMDLTGYTAVGQVRMNYSTASDLIADITLIVEDSTIIAKIEREKTYGILGSNNNADGFVRIGYYDIFLVTPADEYQYFIGGAVMFVQTITKDI